MSGPYPDEQHVRTIYRTLKRTIDGVEHDFPIRIDVVHPIAGGQVQAVFWAYTSLVVSEDSFEYEHEVSGRGMTEEEAIALSVGAFQMIDKKFRLWLERHP